ncbi:MAG TPA: hypothetical protein VJU15_01790 [Gemmatimonadales bacterium]|nr:hypothetical protein [Gemmatimonadales bacterium]
MLRSRFASLLLLLASPAVGGTALPIAHPCPVDAPWLAQHETGHDEHAGHHGQSQAPTDQPSSHSCTCPGACTVGFGLSVPSPAGTITLPGAPVRTLPASVEHSAPWTRSALDRLPPSTAPPIA